MGFAAIIVLLLAAGYAFFWWRRRESRRKLLAAHTIVAEELHRLMETDAPPRVYDVRQPLDLLANSEIIPGSERITPKEIVANPNLISKSDDIVVYCTCPGDTTAIEIVHRALSLDFVKVRILRGGLFAWKEMGYPVERYEKVFHLDTPS